MYAYRVGRDYLKCAVLCYNLGRWKFERSVRLCMEFKQFKITWNKSARRNKMLPSFHKTSSYEGYDKNLKTPPKTMKLPKRTTEIKKGEYIFFILLKRR